MIQGKGLGIMVSNVILAKALGDEIYIEKPEYQEAKYRDIVV